MIRQLTCCGLGADRDVVLGYAQTVGFWKCRDGRSVCGFVEDVEVISVVGSHGMMKGHFSSAADTGNHQVKRLDSQLCPA
jgi:hypothetical protein